ncbi:uncharacterized protein NECHADRAFT_88839 [Fusarium vanettenii 77-13-4]|uniref:Uncharacterized protein n=1 Tax=Fusarium vanettenii (strain ATCC MYA-4622 / CBS 123669 / FGSC 9596 / NRRL 45880 / 77-13-4) TaxID=660122 RepID=C7ZN59_FUSV7|nr:uncharacterized protein NECHADRAFT_88839 [Fusarium vanettenii 77-13-4]EEU34542.1 predicted protein [Fusarium vanettenii 77-13-4]
MSVYWGVISNRHQDFQVRQRSLTQTVPTTSTHSPWHFVQRRDLKPGNGIEEAAAYFRTELIQAVEEKEWYVFGYFPKTGGWRKYYASVPVALVLKCRLDVSQKRWLACKGLIQKQPKDTL